MAVDGAVRWKLLSGRFDSCVEGLEVRGLIQRRDDGIDVLRRRVSATPAPDPQSHRRLLRERSVRNHTLPTHYGRRGHRRVSVSPTFDANHTTLDRARTTAGKQGRRGSAASSNSSGRDGLYDGNSDDSSHNPPRLLPSRLDHVSEEGGVSWAGRRRRRHRSRTSNRSRSRSRTRSVSVQSRLRSSVSRSRCRSSASRSWASNLDSSWSSGDDTLRVADLGGSDNDEGATGAIGTAMQLRQVEARAAQLISIYTPRPETARESERRRHRTRERARRRALRSALQSRTGGDQLPTAGTSSAAGDLAPPLDRVSLSNPPDARVLVHPSPPPRPRPVGTPGYDAIVESKFQRRERPVTLPPGTVVFY